MASRTRREQYWILDGETPVPASQNEWAEYFGKPDRLLFKTDLDDSTVSTVFLGLDHSYGGSTPILFETLVFGGPLADEMDRYATYEQAKVGHIAMVARCFGAREENP